MRWRGRSKGCRRNWICPQAFEITRSLPHGHVAAVLGTARRLGIEELIDATPSRKRDLVTAMLVAQVIDPGSKLAVARGLRAETATSSLGQVLGVSGCDEDDLYAAMDWVHEPAKTPSKTRFAARHLANGTLVLYDVSSAAFEGRTCPLGAIGHPRDGVKGRLQIVYGLLCSTAGIPVAIEVFEGNTADPNTLAAQITKIKTRFGLSRVCLVGDRGMLTHARIRDEVRPAQLDWISALRAPQIKALVEEGALQLSLFDTQDLVEISSPEFPGERLVCCHNPVLAQGTHPQTRRGLLAATKKSSPPSPPPPPAPKWPLRGKERSPPRARQAINHYTPAHTSPSRSPTNPSRSPATPRPSPPRPPSTASTCYAPACPNDTLAESEVVAPLQEPCRCRAVLPHPQHRTRHPPHPPSPGRPGPRPRVPAHAVLLHQLAHESRPGPNPVRRQQQTRRGRQTRQPRRRRPTLRCGPEESGA